jgi:hypothetical protein
MLRIRLVFWYMLFCVRTGARPWRYFQLNAPWFNTEKKLFSKLEMDARIPEQWRLPQTPLDEHSQPSSWPVFLKPEWGQNAKGIFLAENARTFEQLHPQLLNSKVPYLIQNAATGDREFEIFMIRRHADGDDLAVLSITETLNNKEESWPINSILNTDTRHRHIQLDDKELQHLHHHLQQLPGFRIARVGLRADNVKAMIEGDFQIIEINLFVPMPLILLDGNIPLKTRHQFIHDAMLKLAQLTRSVPLSQARKSIFWPMFFLNCRVHS